MNRSVMRNTLAAGSALAALAGAGAQVACAAVTYNVADLGSLGGYNSKGFGINATGITVGQADVVTTTPTYHHAFLNDGTTIRDLGTLGGNYSAAYAINKTNQVVGAAANSTGFNHAFLYNGTAMRDLGTLGGSQSTANAINNIGVIAGRATDINGQFHAFYYTAGKMTEIQTGNTLYSNANGISSNSKVTGLWAPDTSHQAAFIYTLSTNTFQNIGALAGANYAEGFAINRNGVATGASGTNGGTIYGFRYSAGIMHKLPSRGGTQTYGYGINDNGLIVGYSNDTSNVNHAVLIQGTTLTDLNTVIDPNAGWLLTVAHSINNNGDIVGEGVYKGAVRGFLLTPIVVAADPSAPPVPPADDELGDPAE